MSDETYASFQKIWGLQTTAVATNVPEIPHLATHGVRLGEVLLLVRELTAEQATLTARKQEITKRLQEALVEGKRLSAFLNAGVREHYGVRSEKLVEFGLQPFRSRPRVRLVGPDGKPVQP